jgi:hypothetical protein
VFGGGLPGLAAVAPVFLVFGGGFWRDGVGGALPGPGFRLLRSEELFQQFFDHRSNVLSGVG